MAKVEQFILEDGTVGYMSTPDGIEQFINVQDASGKEVKVVQIEELKNVNDRQLHKLINTAGDKKAARDKNGKFLKDSSGKIVIEDRKK